MCFKFKMATLDFGPCTLFMIDGAPVSMHRGLSRCYRRLIQEVKMAAMGFIRNVSGLITVAVWTTLGVLDTPNSP